MSLGDFPPNLSPRTLHLHPCLHHPSPITHHIIATKPKNNHHNLLTMTASSIRILTAATALAAGCHRCSAFTSNGLGGINSQRRARLPPPSSSSAVAAAALAAQRTRTYATSTNMNAASTTIGNLHGQGSCFLPLLQNDEDYIAPRIVQVRSLCMMCALLPLINLEL